MFGRSIHIILNSLKNYNWQQISQIIILYFQMQFNSSQDKLM